MRLRVASVMVWECIECGQQYRHFPNVEEGERCCGRPGARVLTVFEENDEGEAEDAT